MNYDKIRKELKNILVQVRNGAFITPAIEEIIHLFCNDEEEIEWDSNETCLQKEATDEQRIEM